MTISSKTLCSHLILLCVYSSLVNAATIGNGRISLYTGRPIDSTRGSCEVDGRLYPSETAIPMEHECHYCICYQSQVTCYWKSCAAAPRGCVVLHFENVCNPSLYRCKIPAKAKPQPKLEYGMRLNSLRRKRLSHRRRVLREVDAEAEAGVGKGSITSAHLWMNNIPVDEDFPFKFAVADVDAIERSHRQVRAINGSFQHHNHNHHDDEHGHELTPDKSCTILGVKYNLGEVIGIASDVCMECRCTAGSMYCSPKCCFLPSPFKLTVQHQTDFRQHRENSLDDPVPPHPLSYVRHQWERHTFP